MNQKLNFSKNTLCPVMYNIVAMQGFGTMFR